jgi:hypothetical protein
VSQFVTADEMLGGRSVQVKMSRGCFVGGRFIKAPDHPDENLDYTYSSSEGAPE